MQRSDRGALRRSDAACTASVSQHAPLDYEHDRYKWDGTSRVPAWFETRMAEAGCCGGLTNVKRAAVSSRAPSHCPQCRRLTRVQAQVTECFCGGGYVGRCNLNESNPSPHACRRDEIWKHSNLNQVVSAAGPSRVSAASVGQKACASVESTWY